MSERERMIAVMREALAQWRISSGYDPIYANEPGPVEVMADALLATREGAGADWEQYKRDLATVRQAKDETILGLRDQLATAQREAQVLATTWQRNRDAMIAAHGRALEAAGERVTALEELLTRWYESWMRGDEGDELEAPTMKLLYRPEAPRATTTP